MPAPTFTRGIWIPPSSNGERRVDEGRTIVPLTVLRPAGGVEVVGRPSSG